MNPRGTALRLVSGSRSLARPTVRLRLAAIYTGVFLAVGIALIAITYSLLARQLNASGPPQGWLVLRTVQGADQNVQLNVVLNEVTAHQRAVTLHQLVVQAAIALALTTALAAAVGWFASARALRPLRSVTATAHRLSQRNLDERIALRGPRDEIKELADTFDEMLGRLGAAFDAQRRFVANASHELRTPLTRLRALIDVSLADPHADAAALRAMAERVQAAAEDQERLIDGLLTLAQGERGLDRAQPIALADLVTSVPAGHGQPSPRAAPAANPHRARARRHGGRPRPPRPASGEPHRQRAQLQHRRWMGADPDRVPGRAGDPAGHQHRPGAAGRGRSHAGRALPTPGPRSNQHQHPPGERPGTLHRGRHHRRPRRNH